MAPADAQSLERALPEIAARVARRLLAGEGAATRLRGVQVTAGRPQRPGGGGAPGAAALPQSIVTTECLAGIPDGGRLQVAAGATITDLAREEIGRRGIELSADGGEDGRVVALGSDHGGFQLKADLAAWLAEQGYRVHDLGTHDEGAVDYPDFAIAVAREVSSGRATIGICVDGAGIGSAMAAGKVPGVRAANCNSVALAGNAREHNYANVLTLGGRMLSRDEAVAIVRAFLTTPFGAARHGRRVAKIDALDAGRA